MTSISASIDHPIESIETPKVYPITPPSPPSLPGDGGPYDLSGSGLSSRNPALGSVIASVAAATSLCLLVLVWVYRRRKHKQGQSHRVMHLPVMLSYAWNSEHTSATGNFEGTNILGPRIKRLPSQSNAILVVPRCEGLSCRGLTQNRLTVMATRRRRLQAPRMRHCKTLLADDRIAQSGFHAKPSFVGVKGRLTKSRPASCCTTTFGDSTHVPGIFNRELDPAPDAVGLPVRFTQDLIPPQALSLCRQRI